MGCVVESALDIQDDFFKRSKRKLLEKLLSGSRTKRISSILCLVLRKSFSSTQTPNVPLGVPFGKPKTCCRVSWHPFGDQPTALSNIRVKVQTCTGAGNRLSASDLGCGNAPDFGTLLFRHSVWIPRGDNQSVDWAKRATFRLKQR